MKLKKWSYIAALPILLTVLTFGSISLFSHSFAQSQTAKVAMRIGEEKTLEDGTRIGLTKGAGDLIIVTVSRPGPEPSDRGASDLGLWDFRLNVNRTVGKDGFVQKRSGIFDMVIRLRETGNLLRGELLGSMYDNNVKSCDLGTVTGTIQGNRVTLIIEFGDKISCCPGEQWKFTGTINTNKSVIEGSEEPVDLPTSASCVSVYSTFNGHRR